MNWWRRSFCECCDSVSDASRKRRSQGRFREASLTNPPPRVDPAGPLVQYAARRMPSRSSTVTGRGLTRRMRLMPNAFSANGRSCSSFTPRSRSRCGMPMSARSCSTAAIARSAAAVLAQAVHVLAEQPGDGGELRPARRQVEAHHERQQQAVAGAVRAVRRAADRDTPGRGPPRRRRWRTPCRPASPPGPCPRALPGRCRRATARRRYWPISAIAFSASMSPNGCRPW